MFYCNRFSLYKKKSLKNLELQFIMNYCKSFITFKDVQGVSANMTVVFLYRTAISLRQTSQSSVFTSRE